MRGWEKLLGAAGMPWECCRCSWEALSKSPRATGAAPPSPGRRLKQPATAAVRSAARTIRFQNSFAVTGNAGCDSTGGSRRRRR